MNAGISRGEMDGFAEAYKSSFVLIPGGVCYYRGNLNGVFNVVFSDALFGHYVGCNFLVSIDVNADLFGVTVLNWFAGIF